ncbi:hypothetical protein PYW07_005499 [Mythimna separata]|uniref:Pyroglutamyl-peptidase I n=1 Tax=Mythimna separata TaxID=271217 RepID=A0AAD8DR04_MYTSE|nr:hypothetical protein PYW07_005499 [Mythimna separata]
MTGFDVAYKKIDTLVPELWAEHQPDLTIHVGVSNISCIQLETKADRESYDIVDNDQFCPADKKHCMAGPDTITTDLDVAQLHDKFNALEPKVAGLTAQISNDAGKFICEYTYYTSLNCRGPSKTLFVHVPYQGFTEQEIAEGLERILDICLKMM